MASTEVFVNSDTQCDMNISSGVMMNCSKSCASCFEFLDCCFVSPRIGFVISIWNFERLFVTDPILSSMGLLRKISACDRN